MTFDNNILQRGSNKFYALERLMIKVKM